MRMRDQLEAWVTSGGSNKGEGNGMNEGYKKTDGGYSWFESDCGIELLGENWSARLTGQDMLAFAIEMARGSSLRTLEALEKRKIADVCGIAQRLVKSLSDAGIVTVGQMCEFCWERNTRVVADYADRWMQDLLEIRGFGKHCYTNAKEVLYKDARDWLNAKRQSTTETESVSKGAQ